MADEQTAPQEDLKQQIWNYSGLVLLWTTILLTGLAWGWVWWGDATELRGQVKDLTGKVSAARSETENVKAQEGQRYRTLERQNERLLEQMKAAGLEPKLF